MRREMKYRARVKFRSEHDHDETKEVRKALDDAQMKFHELGAIPMKDGVQYLTEIEEDVLAFKAAASIIIRELDERVKELDYSQIEIEISISKCKCGYEARIDDEYCSHCGEKLDLSLDLK